MNFCDSLHQNLLANKDLDNTIAIQNSIQNNFIVYQHTGYIIHNVAHQAHQRKNILSIYTYTIQWLAHAVWAQGAINPIGFMGSLSDSLNTLRASDA